MAGSIGNFGTRKAAELALNEERNFNHAVLESANALVMALTGRDAYAVSIALANYAPNTPPTR